MKIGKAAQNQLPGVYGRHLRPAGKHSSSVAAFGTGKLVDYSALQDQRLPFFKREIWSATPLEGFSLFALRRNRGAIQESLNARKEAVWRFNGKAVRGRLDEIGFIRNGTQEKRRCAGH